MSSNTTKPKLGEDEDYWRAPKDDAGVRRCLACDKEFESEGWHNRLCFKCRKQS